jgi:ferredoxin
VQIIAENGFPRDRLIIIGVPCTGQIDHDKLLPMLIEKGTDRNIQAQNITVTDLNDQFKIEINEQNIELQVPKIDVIFEKCITCKYPNPIIHDIMLTEQVEPRGKAGEGYERVDELGALNDDERWKYWAEKFDRCIRCYACREICPVCYCKECLADKWEPDWVNKSVNLTENTMFHVMRAMHLAGRCIDCHECQRACPVGIPLLDIYKKLEKDVLDEFNFIPGTDPEKKPLLSTFKPDDPGEFIL